MIQQIEFNRILDSFNIKANCVAASSSRHFAFYDLELAPGTRISKIKRYADELAIAMKAHSSLIIKPVPSEGIVRLQTTIDKPDKILFEDIYNKYKTSEGFLPFVLGETDEGQPLIMDLAQNPHLLIGGSTGSGKSVLLHTIIANAAKRNDMRLYLADTKQVEFSVYKHKLTSLVEEVHSDPKELLFTLKHLCDIMEMRYEYMVSLGISKLEERPGLFDKILLIVDEAADIMQSPVGKQFELYITRLAQKARAAGIYIILATQRPSNDVFTGLIKANFPARLACKVTSHFDSKVILDRAGAENLAGKGDAILNNSAYNMTRFQVAFSDPCEI